MRNHLRAELATAALMMAVQRQRPAPGLIQHSDRGIQYACTDYQDALQATGIIPSMSRRANALDNALPQPFHMLRTWNAPPMESFFHTLKTELVHHRIYANHEEARRDLFAYVEGFYNREGCTRAWAELVKVPPAQRVEYQRRVQDARRGRAESTKRSVTTPRISGRINSRDCSIGISPVKS